MRERNLKLLSLEKLCVKKMKMSDTLRHFFIYNALVIKNIISTPSTVMPTVLRDEFLL